MIWRWVGITAILIGLYWHYMSLRADLRAAKSQVVACAATSANHRATIETLERREADNTRQYEATLVAMANAATRTEQGERDRDQQHERDLIQVAAPTGDACADQPLPESIRVQLDPRARGALPHRDRIP